MVRSLKLLLFLLLVAVGAAFAVTLWGELSQGINRNPEIVFDGEEITVSVEDDTAALLQGVTASDPEDGDVTDSLVVEDIAEFQDDGSRTVTYTAFDSTGNVTKATRLLRYSDYHGPEIVLIQELKTVVGGTLNLQDCIRVDDLLDGNITNQLRVVESNYSNYVPGEYQVTFQVTNSAGDTTEQTFTIECVAEQEYGGPSITLSSYSDVIQVGEDFDPEDYIEEVTGYNEEGEPLTPADVEISSGVNTQEPGTYQVGYALTGRDGETGNTRLTITVE